MPIELCLLCVQATLDARKPWPMPQASGGGAGDATGDGLFFEGLDEDELVQRAPQQPAGRGSRGSTAYLACVRALFAVVAACLLYRRMPKFSPHGSVCCACAHRKHNFVSTGSKT